VDEGLIRLDRYLAKVQPQFSRSRIQALLSQGAFCVNGKEERASYLVRSGDCIVLQVPPVEASTYSAEELPLDILYEDDDVMVINKQAGMTVHPSHTQKTGTLVNALLARAHGLSTIGGVERPGIVHRLDKNTSGVIIVAKHDIAHRHLSSQFHQREVKKIYVGFVIGRPPEQGEWRESIGRHRTDRKRFSTGSMRSKPAHTRFVCRGHYGGVSELELELLTGRTHQIRVHAASAGFPLVGDTLYGSERKVRLLKPANIKQIVQGFERQALHAASLELVLPNGRKQCFSAPWPVDLLELKKSLMNST